MKLVKHHDEVSRQAKVAGWTGLGIGVVLSALQYLGANRELLAFLPAPLNLAVFLILTPLATFLTTYLAKPKGA